MSPGHATCLEKIKSETSSSTAESNLLDFEDTLQNEFRFKREAAQSSYEVAKEKEWTKMWLVEMKFLTTSTKDMSDEYA